MFSKVERKALSNLGPSCCCQVSLQAIIPRCQPGEPQKASSLALKMLWPPLLPCNTQASCKWEGEALRTRGPRLWAEAMCYSGRTPALVSHRRELQVPLGPYQLVTLSKLLNLHSLNFLNYKITKIVSIKLTCPGDMSVLPPFYI